MRITITLALTCVVALALGATNAFATEAVEVTDELGNPCNPCSLHGEGEAELHHPFFGQISSCVVEAEGELYHTPASNPSGTWGHVTHWSALDHPVDGDCTRENCDGDGEPAGEADWDVTSAEETGPDQGEVNFRLCLDANNDEASGGTGLHCDADATLIDLGNHNGEATMNQECATSAGTITIIGHMTLETGLSHEGVEVVHLGVPAG